MNKDGFKYTNKNIATEEVVEVHTNARNRYIKMNYTHSFLNKNVLLK